MVDIFDFVADGTRNHLWNANVERVILAAGPAERAVWAQDILVNGRVRKADYRVTFYERPHRIEFIAVNGSPRPIFLYELRAIDADSTSVTLTVEVTPRWSPFPTFRIGGTRAREEAARLSDLAEALSKSAS